MVYTLGKRIHGATVSNPEIEIDGNLATWKTGPCADGDRHVRFWGNWKPAWNIAGPGQNPRPARTHEFNVSVGVPAGRCILASACGRLLGSGTCRSGALKLLRGHEGQVNCRLRWDGHGRYRRRRRNSSALNVLTWSSCRASWPFGNVEAIAFSSDGNHLPAHVVQESFVVARANLDGLAAFEKEGR
jgi:hypothetical protein